MREILFRGKRKDNGEWVEGAFCQKDSDSPFGELVDKPSIIKYDDPFSGFWFEVDPETVGQYTGLTDQNGKKIFEGDIVDILTENEEVGAIEWADGEAMFMLSSDGWCANFDNYYPKDVEVIGNIHDNPELLPEPPKEKT